MVQKFEGILNLSAIENNCHGKYFFLKKGRVCQNLEYYLQIGGQKNREIDLKININVFHEKLQE